MYLMRIFSVLTVLALALPWLTSEAQHAAPVAPMRPTTDTYFGTEVVDPISMDGGRRFRITGAAATAKYENMRVYFHKLGTEEVSDVPVFGPDLTSDPILPKYGNVAVQVVQGTKMLLASQVSGVVQTEAIWVRHTDDGPWIQVGRAQRRSAGIRNAWHARLCGD
jgi:hypothetical protein